MKHTHTINNYHGTMEQLAEEIGDLFYDSLADFLHLLSEKLHRDANADLARQRFKLGGHLKECSLHLERASHEIQRAWTLCEPHVPQEHKLLIKKDVNQQRSARACIAEETLNILRNGYYQNPLGQQVDINAALQTCQTQTRLYLPHHAVQLPAPSDIAATWEVVNETTLCGAQRLHMEGNFHKIGVLNFASAKNPGGGFIGGSQAQEESLARSSTLYASLQQCPEYYAHHRQVERSLLYTNRVIYSPNCAVFRHDTGQLLNQPYHVDFITSAAPNRGAIARNEAHNLPQIGEIIPQRIAHFLAIAAEQNCDALILGAWGCGVFGNDPQQIADAFAEILQQQGYAHYFKHICFSIPYSAKAPMNFQAFAERFSTSS